MVKRYKLILLVIPLLFSKEVFPQAGHLDPTFGQGGIITSAFNTTGNSVLNSTVLQKDGKLIAGGYAQDSNHYAFTVARYNTDGSLDNSFGTGGFVITSIGTINDIGTSVTLQNDGKIVLAGYSSVGAYDEFALVRYNSNGALDTTFGIGGIVTTMVGTSYNRINSVKIQIDGKIVAVGFAYVTGDVDDAVVRYNSDGSLDNTFGNNGIVLTPVSNTSNNAYSVGIQSNGKLVVAGYAVDGVINNVSLFRLNQNGNIDSTFGTNGIILTSYENSITAISVAIQNNGKIYTAGFSYNDTATKIALLCYNSNGELDSAFGKGGIVTSPIGTEAYSIALQSNGKIVLAGTSYQSGDPNFATLRFNTDGSLDSTFGTNGAVITSYSSNDLPGSVLIQKDGKIITSGTSGPTFHGLFTILRYNTDGSSDHTFANSGISISHPGESHNYAVSSIAQKDGKIIEAGFSKNTDISTDYDFTLSRFNEEGKPDSTFGDNGISITRIDYTDEFGRSVAVQSNGKIIVAGHSNSSVAVARFNINGVIDKSFGNSGVVSIGIGTHDDEATSVAVQSDDKIVTAGYTNNGYNNDVFISRFESNGDPDKTFGVKGIVITPIGSGDDVANSIAIQKDGKLVVAGYSLDGSYYDACLIRYNSNGDLDSTFGTNGIVLTPAATSDEANTIVIQSDDKIVAGGYSFSRSDKDFAIFRYKSNGSPDSTFGINGIVTTAIGKEDDMVNSVVIQSDEKILAGGVSNRGKASDFAAVRYNKDGTLDNTFGTGGIEITPIGSSLSSANFITLQKDGRILEAGNSWDGHKYSIFTLVRYLSDNTTGIREVNMPDKEKSFLLEQNYPNPFNLSTKIKYQLPNSGFVTLKIYNLMGREVKTLVNHKQNYGYYEVDVKKEGLENGVYLYRLTVGNDTKSRIMILSK